jgi:hypothetical protein
MAFITEVTLKKDGLHAYLDENGAFIGNGTPLLDFCADSPAGNPWSSRPKHILQRLLSVAYGGSVNVDAAHRSLERVAKALNGGDISLASIALVHANFPPLANISRAEKMSREDALFKASVDDPVHPGNPTGTPGGLGGKFAPKYNSPQQVAYFNHVYQLIHDMAQRLNVNENWILGLSAYESGYLNDHNTGLCNPFGLTAGGGNNLSFRSYEEAVAYWERNYGDIVRNAARACRQLSQISAETSWTAARNVLASLS